MLIYLKTYDMKDYFMNLSKSAELLGHVCFFGGFASIIGSIAIWYLESSGVETPELRAQDFKAHGERFGIFIGLWAPTFFILSHRLSHFAKESSEKKA